MTIVCNEIEPYAVRWLDRLMAAGEVPHGHIDNRPIQHVGGSDYRHATQVHLFAGIGGWPLALRLAGWPDDRPVWTGSCPCQPFSVAGKGKGKRDERHLWPAMLRLIAECRPPVIFGEQVASADGRVWLAGVRADLEALGYAVGAADLCAAGIGAPHIRQRLFWVAYLHGDGCGAGRETAATARHGRSTDADGGGTGRLADAPSASGPQHEHEPGEGSRRPPGSQDTADGRGAIGEPARGLGDTASRYVGTRNGQSGPDAGSQEPHRGSGLSGGLGYADDSRPQGLRGNGDHRDRPGRISPHPLGPVTPPSIWGDTALVQCRDGKLRRISAQPGDEPLAYGLPRSVGPGSTRGERMGLVAAKANRRGRLTGYGNAIVPELAAEFVRAFMEAIAGSPTADRTEGSREGGDGGSQNHDREPDNGAGEGADVCEPSVSPAPGSGVEQGQDVLQAHHEQDGAEVRERAGDPADRR